MPCFLRQLKELGFCGVQNFNNSNGWDYGQWDTWAQTAPNKDVKIYIGAPAAPSAASSGYVDADTLAEILQSTQKNYTSFGGAMLWDASQAFGTSYTFYLFSTTLMLMMVLSFS